MHCADGRTTQFWTDTWCGNTTLASAFPSLAAHVADIQASVFSLVSPLTGLVSPHFEGWLTPLLVQDILRLLQNTREYIWTDEPDYPVWTPTPSKGYSTKSCYSNLLPISAYNPVVTPTWKALAPLKVKLHAVLAVRYRLLMGDRLARLSSTQMPSCPPCSLAPKMVEHLFFHCTFTKVFLYPIKVKLKVKHWPATLPLAWTCWRTRHTLPPSRKCWDATFLVVIWLIWVEQNNRIFRDSHSSTDTLRHRIRSFASLWCTTLDAG